MNSIRDSVSRKEGRKKGKGKERNGKEKKKIGLRVLFELKPNFIL